MDRAISDEDLIARLRPRTGKLRMVLDTDTYNEVDDQFALVYALRSPERLSVEAVYAAPFHNSRSSGPGDGMEKSYAEILRLLGTMGVRAENFVYKGSERYLGGADTPVDSPAVRDLIRRAMAGSASDPLYVVAIGAITNVASAILLEPAIIDRIVVVWLGGHPHYWNHTREFNLQQDIPAARLVFDCGVPLVQIPCAAVASHLLSTVAELEACIGGKNPICDALVELFKAYNADHFGWAKEIWDVAAIAWMIEPAWVPTELAHSPVLTDSFTWSRDGRRHLIRVASAVKRNDIFKDMFGKLARG